MLALIASPVLAQDAAEPAPAPAEAAPAASELPAAPAPGETPTPATPARSGPTASESAVSDHQAQLVSFQKRITDLSRRIDNAEARTKVLKSSAISGSVLRTRALILHRNGLGGSFTMVRASYILDGKSIFDRDNADGRLDDSDPIQLFSGPIRAGPHELRVSVRVGGQAYGPFTYLEGYKFNINSKYVFEVVEGRLNRLEIISTQKDDITLEPQDRLTIDWRSSIVEPTASGE